MYSNAVVVQWFEPREAFSSLSFSVDKKQKGTFMFVLPKPPAHRDGRRRATFSSRPVSAADLISARLAYSSANVRVVHDDGVNWFPAREENGTFQDEFAARTHIIHVMLTERDQLRQLFAEGHHTITATLLHQLVFDEQWEREAIATDGTKELWTQLSCEASVIVLSEVVKEERLGRTAIEQLAVTNLWLAVATAEYIARRCLAAEQAAALAAFHAREERERSRALVSSAATSDRRTIEAYEWDCHRYLCAQRTASQAVTELKLEETAMRMTIRSACDTSRRALLASHAEGTLRLIFVQYTVKTMGDCTVTQLLHDSATQVQRIVRGWRCRRQMQRSRLLFV